MAFSVSVIIPVYNVEAYLRKCLDSVVNQTLRDIEIICVDDGSADGSSAILADYAAKDSRIRVITQTNSGAAAARNAGLAAATGEYLFFFDADDYCKKEMLERLYACATSGQCDVVVTSAYSCSVSAGGVYRKWMVPADFLKGVQPFDAASVAGRIFQDFFWVPWNKLFRRAFVVGEGITWQNLPLCNDIAFVCTALALAKRISVMNGAYYYYRKEVEGSVSTARKNFPFAESMAWDEVSRRLSGKNCLGGFAQSIKKARLVAEIDALSAFADINDLAERYKLVREEILPRYGLSSSLLDDSQHACRDLAEAIERSPNVSVFLLALADCRRGKAWRMGVKMLALRKRARLQRDEAEVQARRIADLERKNAVLAKTLERIQGSWACRVIMRLAAIPFTKGDG